MTLYHAGIICLTFTGSYRMTLLSLINWMDMILGRLLTWIRYAKIVFVFCFDFYYLMLLIGELQVLMVGSKNATLIGKPLLSGIKVQAVVEEMAKDKKVITLKFRRRKNSKNIRGFRRELTVLRVKEITLDADSKKDLGV